MWHDERSLTNEYAATCKFFGNGLTSNAILDIMRDDIEKGLVKAFHEPTGFRSIDQANFVLRTEIFKALDSLTNEEWTAETHPSEYSVVRRCVLRDIRDRKVSLIDGDQTITLNARHLYGWSKGKPTDATQNDNADAMTDEPDDGIRGLCVRGWVDYQNRCRRDFIRSGGLRGKRGY